MLRTGTAPISNWKPWAYSRAVGTTVGRAIPVVQPTITALPQVSRGFARSHRGLSAEKHVTPDELKQPPARKLAVRGFHIGGGTSAG